VIALADLSDDAKVSVGRSVRIVVVDDEPVIAWTLEMILREKGYDTVSFTNPLTALERALDFLPDVMVTDVMMPQLSGIELAMRLNELCPQCKVLLFSGSAQSADLLDACQRGYDFRLLHKPVHPTELLSQLRALHS
jgi:CheY-like chemotaxis protein